MKATTWNVELWVENTLDPNNNKNHKKWSEPLKMLIMSRKHDGAKQHWETWQVKGTTQNVDFEQEALGSLATLGAITAEGNHPKF